MNTRLWVFALFCGVGALAFPIQAQVIRDGSIGALGAGSVSQSGTASGGTQYDITEADGELVGGRNLFHSFSQFDLDRDDQAIYTGAASIENLITRVTGGPSSIDGLIESQIPGANLFFLNPAGVLFGENASIDVTGALVVSTADRLLFESGEILEVGDLSTPILSVSDVRGLGFLDAPAPITIVGSQIEGAPEKSLSLVGGDITIRGGRADGEAASLAVRSGRIDFVSLGSSGEVELDADIDGDGTRDSLVRVSDNAIRGDIEIAGNVTISTTGANPDAAAGLIEAPFEGAGPINLYGDDFLLEDADIRIVTVTGTDAGDLVADLTGDFVARTIPGGLQTGIVAGSGLRKSPAPGEIVTGFGFGTYSTSMALFQLCGFSVCGFIYEAPGNGGEVNIRARNVLLEDGARITARSDSLGDGGQIILEVSDSITIRGQGPSGERGGLSSTAEDVGNPGTIEIRSPNATLDVSDFGTIVIQNSESSLATGEPGQIDVDVRRIELSENGRIDSSTRGAGPGGDLNIRARDSIRLSGRLSDTEFAGITTLAQPGSSGLAGEIRVEAPIVELLSGAEIAARPVGVGALGAAGNITLEVDDRLRLVESTISTESDGAAGGNIDVTVGRLMTLDDASITTSVTAGEDSGGNVTITTGPDSALVLDASRIVAQADVGAGGVIRIDTALLLRDPDSLIDASAFGEGGVDGEVIGRAPDGDLIDLRPSLETPPIDATTLLREPCAARDPGAANSLVFEKSAVVFGLADDFLSGRLPVSIREGLEVMLGEEQGGQVAFGEAWRGSAALGCAPARDPS